MDEGLIPNVVPIFLGFEDSRLIQLFGTALGFSLQLNGDANTDTFEEPQEVASKVENIEELAKELGTSLKLWKAHWLSSPQVHQRNPTTESNPRAIEPPGLCLEPRKSPLSVREAVER